MYATRWCHRPYGVRVVARVSRWWRHPPHVTLWLQDLRDLRLLPPPLLRTGLGPSSLPPLNLTRREACVARPLSTGVLLNGNCGPLFLTLRLPQQQATPRTSQAVQSALAPTLAIVVVGCQL